MLVGAVPVQSRQRHAGGICAGGCWPPEGACGGHRHIRRTGADDARDAMQYTTLQYISELKPASDTSPASRYSNACLQLHAQPHYASVIHLDFVVHL